MLLQEGRKEQIELKIQKKEVPKRDLIKVEKFKTIRQSSRTQKKRRRQANGLKKQ